MSFRIFGAVGLMWPPWPVKHSGTATRAVPARCVQALRRFPGRSPAVTPRQPPEPGGDARAAAPARPDRTSRPGTTFVTAITTGHRHETHECFTVRTLLRRVPHPCANQG